MGLWRGPPGPLYDVDVTTTWSQYKECGCYLLVVAKSS